MLRTVLLLLLPVTALAGTPDGQTPAEETVCDALYGAEYGLCTAYCEAMDCDSDSPNASDQACERVRENFQRASGGDDPPCEASDDGGGDGCIPGIEC